MRKLSQVLVIDDDDEYNFLTEDTFNDTNLECTLTFKLSAQEALGYLEENPDVDLILLDINMPIMNGWEFLEEYQKRNYHIDRDAVVVVTSSSCYVEDRDKAMSFPKVVDYVEKPLSCQTLYHLHDSFFSPLNRNS